MMSLFKSIAFFSAIAGFLLFQQANAQYSVTLPYKQVTVENRNGTAVFNGAELTGKPGQPLLPYYTVSILLPPDVNFEDVTVSLNSSVYSELSGTFDVSPANPPNDANNNSVWPDAAKIVDGKDTSIYHKDAFFPADFDRGISFDKMWHYKVVRVIIYPYLYNPVLKRLRQLTGGAVEVSVRATTTVPPAVTAPRIAWVEKQLRAILANPETLDTYGTTLPSLNSAPPSATSFSGTYVIITTNAIVNNSTKLSSYQSDLGTYGFGDVKIITEGTSQTATTYAEGSSAQQTAYNIRQWLKDYCDNNNDLHYVLLIGNPDPDLGDVPMKRMTCAYGVYGIDMYYADLTDDGLPELAVGRIPLYNKPGTTTPNTDNLDMILQKTMDYKSATDIEWRRFALVPIVPLFSPPKDGTKGDFSFGDEMVEDFLKPDGFLSRRLYEPYMYNEHYVGYVPAVINADTLAEVTSCNYWVVRDEWNNYNPGLVVWHTHGGPQVAAGILLSRDLDPAVPTVEHLDNDYPAIVCAASCLTSRAQDHLNLGSETLLHNAVAYVGATIEASSGQGVARLFVENVLKYPAINDDATVGNAMMAVYSSSDGDKNVFVLYGCPEVQLNLPESFAPAPEAISVEAISNSQINISWPVVTDANGNTADNYVIERGDATATRVAGWSVLATGVTANTYQDMTVSEGTKYKYRVYATKSGVRSGYSPIDSTTTYDLNNQSLLPGQPSNLNANPGCYNAVLSWTGSAGATSYNIKRATEDENGNIGPYVTVGKTSLQPFYTCEAEDPTMVTRLGTADSNTNHRRFSGTGFIDGFLNSSSAGVSFTVSVPSAGNYGLRLRYSAGAGESSNMGLHVNGTYIKNITCPATANWDTWAHELEVVSLNAGNNTIKYNAESASTNCINIDYISVNHLTVYTDINLLNGNEYYYVVSAVNEHGQSGDCSPYSVTPQSRPVDAGPTFNGNSEATCNSIAVWWTNNANNAEYNEIEYSYTKNVAGDYEQITKPAKIHRLLNIFTIYGLDNDQTVSFRFRAVNDYGPSAWTAPVVCFTDDGTSLGVPSFTVTAINPGTLRLTWSSNSPGVTHGYQIYQKDGYPNAPSGVFRLLEEYPSTTNSIDFPTEEAHVDSFSIRAINESDCGISYSDFYPKQAVFSGSWPVNPPSGLAAWSVSRSEIDLQWTDNSAGEVGFRIERREKGSDNWVLVGAAAANATSIRDGTASRDMEYEYRVRATCVAGWWPGYSPWSNTAIASTFDTEDDKPQVNTSLESSIPNEIIVNWECTLRNAVMYTIEQSTEHGSSAPDESTFSTIATRPNGINSFPVTGLTPGVTYWFRVRAENWVGSGKGVVSGAQTAPAMPTNLTVTAISSSQVRVSWTDNSNYEDGFVLGYWQENPTSQEWSRERYVDLPADLTSCVVTDFFSPDKTYWFQIRAYNTWGSRSDFTDRVYITMESDPCFNTKSNVNGLNGTVFGATPSWADGSEYCKATDGDTGTFYDYKYANGGYTGLDLDPPRKIAKIRYYPRAGYTSRMVGGKFQGSNTKDFSVFDSLHTVPSTVTPGWNEYTILGGTSIEYQYVRYLSPDGGHGNIAEMAFYEVETQYTIEYSVVGNGSITPVNPIDPNDPVGSTTVNSHANQTFTITPNSGYLVNNVTVDGANKGAITSYTFSNVTMGHTISATFKPLTKHEAENAALSGGAKGNWDHTGYSGAGFVDGFYYSASARASFTVYTEVAGIYEIDLRYSAGNGTSTNTELHVNGVNLKKITCPATANWDTWAHVSERVTLNAGENTITYEADDTPVATCINLDYIRLTYLGTLWLEAEDAALSDAYVNTNHGGYSGTGFVDGFYNSEAAQVSFTVNNAQAAGEYTLKLHYSAGNGTSTNTKLNVNDDKVHTITCPATENWDTWADYFEPVYLENGDNMITFKADEVNTKCINIDYISILYIPVFPILVTHSDGGSISPGSDAVYVPEGGSQTFTITPGIGCDIDNVLVDRENYQGPVTSYTFTDVKGMHYISALFKPLARNEAENATLSGTASISTSHIGYSGTGFVDGFYNSATAKASFTVFAQNAGSYAVRLRYSAGNGPSVNTGLYVNGERIKNIYCPATADWDSWANASEQVVLKEGYNTIEYKAEVSTSNCINLDYISLTYLGTMFYEAEDMILLGTAHRNTNHSGYSGSSFVDGFFYSTTGAVSFNVSVQLAGEYSVGLHYSAGGGTSTNTGLFVNGERVKGITCRGTGDWETWADASETVRLNAGSNIIEYRSETSTPNCINLDYVHLTYLGILTFEIENAFLSGTANVNTNHAGYSGTGFVDGFYNSAVARVSFSVNVMYAGSYAVTLRYSAGNGTSSNTGLYLNGVKIKNITCPATTNWETWAEASETVTLYSGINSIEYKSESSTASCINLDKITLSR
jgi:hypothetical protein